LTDIKGEIVWYDLKATPLAWIAV